MPRFRRPSVPATLAFTALVAAVAVPAYGDEVAQMAVKLTKKDGKKMVKVLPKNSITGKQVKESSLAKVPSAARADSATSAANAANATNAASATNAQNAANAANAAKLEGKAASDFAAANLVRRISRKLSFGEDVELVANGRLSLRASCIGDESGTSYLRIYARTTEANSFMDGDNDYNGGSTPGDFLQPATAATSSVLWSVNQSTGTTTPYVSNDIDDGWVASASGATISGDGEEIILGLHAFGADCAVRTQVALDTVS